MALLVFGVVLTASRTGVIGVMILGAWALVDRRLGAASRRVLLSGLSGAEGALIDPVTGDFLFSTFNGGNQLVRVSGFVAPPEPVPLPATLPLLLGAVGVLLARRRPR